MKQERIDCAMLMTPSTQGWAGHWLGHYAKGRMCIHALDMHEATDAAGLDALLAWLGLELSAYDVCLLPVCADNLSWTRTLLGQARVRLRMPLIAMTSGLKAVAIHDLLACGVADFIREPGCNEECSTRIANVLSRARSAQLEALSRSLAGKTQAATPPAASVVAEPPAVYADPALGSSVQNGLLRLGGEALEACAAATAVRCAMCDEPFQRAKRRVVNGFERAYLSASLGRHAGNIAQAAKAAQKHRRAYWQLVRKHCIDIAQYREPEQTPQERGG